MNYLWLTMMMCAVVALTVHGQYIVNAPATAIFGSSASWQYFSEKYIIDKSNDTCVTTDVYGSPGQSFKVIYSTTHFVPSTIYLVGPNVVTNDMTDAATIAYLSWGMAGGVSALCKPLVPFSQTNNVASWICPAYLGTQMTMNITANYPTRSVSICNVIVYSFDAQFSAVIIGHNLVTAYASVSFFEGANWVRTFPISNVVDDSNTTCIMTDVNVPTSNSNSLSVSYSGDYFIPTAIYLVGPSVVPYDMTVAGNIENIRWGYEYCTASVTFSFTNNVASYSCSNFGRSDSLTIYIKGLVQINLIFCNILVYTNDPKFSTATTPMTTTTGTTAVNRWTTQRNSKTRLTGIIDYLLESIKLSLAEIRSLSGY